MKTILSISLAILSLQLVPGQTIATNTPQPIKGGFGFVLGAEWVDSPKFKRLPEGFGLGQSPEGMIKYNYNNDALPFPFTSGYVLVDKSNNKIVTIDLTKSMSDFNYERANEKIRLMAKQVVDDLQGKYGANKQVKTDGESPGTVGDCFPYAKFKDGNYCIRITVCTSTPSRSGPQSFTIQYQDDGAIRAIQERLRPKIYAPKVDPRNL